MDNNNLWMYSDYQAQNHVACGLITFGADAFKRAKIISDLHILENLTIELSQNGINNFTRDTAYDFATEYLIDTIRIISFFENYMKAELILKGYLVHSIKNTEKFKHLAKKQRKEPIHCKEIHDVKNFTVDTKSMTIYHEDISSNTISFSTLTSNINYTKNYMFDNEILSTIIELNVYRNRLHFNIDIPFETSIAFINKLKRINAFVDYTVGRMTK